MSSINILINNNNFLLETKPALFKELESDLQEIEITCKYTQEHSLLKKKLNDHQAGQRRTEER